MHRQRRSGAPAGVPDRWQSIQVTKLKKRFSRLLPWPVLFFSILEALTSFSCPFPCRLHPKRVIAAIPSSTDRRGDTPADMIFVLLARTQLQLPQHLAKR